MKSTPFDPATDLAPIPFEERHCLQALRLKEAGLGWKPHAGCFVWDQEGVIKVPSPFPQQIYFILNLGRFLEIFKTLARMTEKLVWLPTWHQCWIILKELGIDNKTCLEKLSVQDSADGSRGIYFLYDILIKKLKE